VHQFNPAAGIASFHRQMEREGGKTGLILPLTNAE
jgi:hypothetical protein